MLFISFVTGSLANFGSLLTFNSDSGLCAFAVAWGDLAVETARLMGIFVLLLTLRHLGMKRWELIVSLVWLLIGLAFVFINTALATGSTTAIQPLAVSLCVRGHNPPASLASSGMYLVLEVYVVGRLWFRLPRLNESRARWTYLLDIRMLRGFSLVLLNLLTAVPSAIPTNKLAESIPYSIGAIAVLLAFNHEADDWALCNREESPSISLPPTPTSAPARRNTRLSIPAFSAWVSHHPFSARCLNDPEILPTWDDERRQARRATARSTKTIDSPTARSIREAVVQHARREILTPTTSLPPRSAFQTSTDPEPSTSRPSKGKQFIRPVLPKLIIVNPINDCRPEQRSERDPPSTREQPPTSHFSLPSLADSRSTVTYPERVLSFSSTHHDSVVGAMSTVESGSESLSPQMHGNIAVDMNTRIMTNPDLLGPPLASPLGPRFPGNGRWL